MWTKFLQVDKGSPYHLWVLSRAQRWNQQRGVIRWRAATDAQQTRSRLQLVRRMCESVSAVLELNIWILTSSEKSQALRLVPCVAKQTVLLENFLCGTIHQHPALHLHSRRPRIPPSGWGQSHLSFFCMLENISNNTINSHSEVMGPVASFELIVNWSRYVHLSVPSMFNSGEAV